MLGYVRVLRGVHDRGHGVAEVGAPGSASGSLASGGGPRAGV
jgi:hypothetical protein